MLDTLDVTGKVSEKSTRCSSHLNSRESCKEIHRLDLRKVLSGHGGSP